MKEFSSFLNEYKAEISNWIEDPTVYAPPEIMERILLAIELTIELINSNQKVSKEDKQLFEGGTYLYKYFDGWGETYFDKYLYMVKYIKANHY